jgi:hypothetical protein
MIYETLYSHSDLEFGVCRECGQHSHEILKGDGRCVECIDAALFYEMTMLMKPHEEENNLCCVMPCM